MTGPSSTYANHKGHGDHRERTEIIRLSGIEQSTSL